MQKEEVKNLKNIRNEIVHKEPRKLTDEEFQDMTGKDK